MKTHTKNAGESNGNNKLTEEKVRDIRRRLRAQETQRALAEAYGVSKTTIAHIKTRVTWGHLDDA